MQQLILFEHQSCLNLFSVYHINQRMFGITNLTVILLTMCLYQYHNTHYGYCRLNIMGNTLHLSSLYQLVNVFDWMFELIVGTKSIVSS